MTTKKILVYAMVIGSLFLGGCVATPYYGSSGYIGRTVYGTSYPSYFGNFGYVYRQPIMSGHIHLGNGHRHFMSGGHSHHGHHGHRHFGGGHGHHHGGHRGHR
ncbi:hypothetical protein ABF87_07805 [Nitrosomonas sp. JL21]|uniref:hypothetical protein n=1 Tax=Nitrosomonas sp. JL21 TaxID=153949 RepID=UPI0013DDE211|nr:hypothetical protein [Nitrosomonas sp. JL21]MBL8496328.1 hypothetical protein [Nitrosomonas sp.]MCC7091769.1 hypothetical protein [Nitrosomonas sp.]MXS77868.1 hypothetical protein [Nitrosomonas sp. JL21]